MPETCVVIPCFNEERRLRGDEILDFLHRHDNVTICFVNDGSSDGTLARIDAIKELAPKAVIALSLPVNSGKAEAVRRGVLYAASLNRFALIGYWDADMSTPLTELTGMLGVFEANPSCALAMGTRVKRLGSNIQRSAVRHYLGRVFSTTASLLLNLPVYDSQCGAKVVRADLVPVLFQESFLTKWVFDVEILARLRNLIGRALVLDAVTEVPLNVWIEMGGSKLRLSHVARVPIELLRIARHYNGKLAHKAPFSQLDPSPERLGSSDTTRGTPT
jgi:glycosyltransferase involved in cell wall biosynthesis